MRTRRWEATRAREEAGGPGGRRASQLRLPACRGPQAQAQTCREVGGWRGRLPGTDGAFKAASAVSDESGGSFSALAPGAGLPRAGEGGRERPLTAAGAPFSPAGCGRREAARHVDGGCRQLRRQGRGGGAGGEEAAEGLLRLPRD